MHPLLPLGAILLLGAAFASTSSSEMGERPPSEPPPPPRPLPPPPPATPARPTRWEATTVRKGELADLLAEGWEPIGATIAPGHTMQGVPVTREVWHLRRPIQSEEYGLGTGIAGIRGAHLRGGFSQAQIDAYNREGALQGLRGVSVAPPG